ncbi:TetR/AcrR family transcriptional regulator [Propionicimonas sp.]|uniref:TetR/AcrR family transcriptional regulator n=1 Tax=Propionicimonas sp. TaxID=1955623 RepID=UPI0039E308F6
MVVARAGLTTQAVVERAAELLEQDRSTELTLAALARSLGVRTPSLYKHVAGADDLRRSLMIRAKTALADALARAAIGRSRDDALHAVAAAYRDWALQHPAQYPLTVRAPQPGDVDDERASAASLEVIYSILAGYRLAGDDAVHATRLLRSVLHGFLSLENAGAFRIPLDTEASYTRAVDSVIAALNAWHRG